MKHLKTFNEAIKFLLPAEILDDLKDICLDLGDRKFYHQYLRSVGYRQLLHYDEKKTVKNNIFINGVYYSILDVKSALAIWTDNEFKYNKVSDVVDHIISYMKMNGYETILTKCSDNYKFKIAGINVNIPSNLLNFERNRNLFQVVLGFIKI